MTTLAQLLRSKGFDVAMLYPPPSLISGFNLAEPAEHPRTCLCTGCRRERGESDAGESY